MRLKMILGVVVLSILACFAGCGGTRYENGVKIEKSGWFGSVEQEVNSDSEGS